MTDKEAANRRLGGRGALVLTQVRRAVEGLIKENGIENITVPMVAEKAGVNPTSVYRRWGDLPTLVNDIATYQLDPARLLPSSGDFKADLTIWAQELVDHYRTKPVNAALLRAGTATAGQRESDCLRNRRTELEVFCGRAEAKGTTTDQLLEGIVAPIIYRVLYLPWTLAENSATGIVERFFRS